VVFEPAAPEAEREGRAVSRGEGCAQDRGSQVGQGGKVLGAAE